MSNARLTWLLAFLILALLVRFAMEWGPEWSLILLFPLGYLLARDIRRWRRGSVEFSLLRGILRTILRGRFRVSFLFHRGLVHRDPSRPKGYCPKCGYPMNPGICTECGTDVGIMRLRRSAPSKLWQYRGKVITAIAVVTLICVGKYLHDNYAWAQARSNDTLFDLMAVGNDPAIRELENRHRAGKLSKTESAQLFDRSLSTSLQLLSPYPSDANLGFMLNIDSSLPTLVMDHGFYIGKHVILCDGEVLQRSEEDKRRRSRNEFMGRWMIFTKAVKPGTHEISVKGEFILSDGVGSAATIDLLAVHQTPFLASGTIEVVEQPSTDFLQQLTDRKTIAEYARNTYIEATYALPTASTGFRYDPNPEKIIRVGRSSNELPMIGRIEIRPTGQPNAAWQLLGRVYITGFNYTDYPISKIESLRDVSRVDVRFVPEPTQVVQYIPRGIQTYCNTMVEQSELSWPAGKPEEDWHWGRRGGQWVIPKSIPMPEE